MSIIELLEKMEELSTDTDIQSYSKELDSLTDELETVIMSSDDNIEDRIYKLQYEEF